MYYPVCGAITPEISVSTMSLNPTGILMSVCYFVVTLLLLFIVHMKLMVHPLSVYTLYVVSYFVLVINRGRHSIYYFYDSRDWLGFSMLFQRPVFKMNSKGINKIHYH